MHAIKLASVLSPLSDANLRMAAQSGVEEIVARYSGPDLSSINTNQARIESFGMRLGVIEGGLPIDAIKLGVDDGTELDQMKALVRHLGTIGVPIVCYNFMAGTDWIRTSIDTPERGGSKVTAFDLGRLGDARIPGHDPYIGTLEPGARRDDLWANLEAFLNEIIPVAEEAGVVMAIHPDDPPFSLFGLPRVVSTADDARKLLNAIPSPANGLTMCAGSYGARGDNDLVAMIREFHDRIYFVHLRNIKREDDGSFYESDHLDGDNDIVGIVNALLDEEQQRQGLPPGRCTIPMRPDHGHAMGEEKSDAAVRPGYSYAGRMKGLAELRGVMHALTASRRFHEL